MKKEIVQTDIKEIKQTLQKALGRADYISLNRMGGLTNRTYKVVFSDDSIFVVRIPGEGTQELIVRSDEKTSTQLACDLGIDAELFYFGTDGAKVSQYIPDAVTMSSETMKLPENVHRAAEIFKKLHGSNFDTGVKFEVFDMAEGYEKVITEYHVSMYSDYVQIKNEIMKIKEEIDAVKRVKKVPCHNDALCENWVMSGNERMYLVDWEYAGMNDAMWDLADVSIEASYNLAIDEMFLTEYLEHKPTDIDWKCFLANKLYVDYLWTLWAKARVPYDGKPMEEWAFERYERLKKNIITFRTVRTKISADF